MQAEAFVGETSKLKFVLTYSGAIDNFLHSSPGASVTNSERVMVVFSRKAKENINYERFQSFEGVIEGPEAYLAADLPFATIPQDSDDATYVELFDKVGLSKEDAREFLVEFNKIVTELKTSGRTDE